VLTHWNNSPLVDMYEGMVLKQHIYDSISIYEGMFWKQHRYDSISIYEGMVLKQHRYDFISIYEEMALKQHRYSIHQRMKGWSWHNIDLSTYLSAYSFTCRHHMSTCIAIASAQFDEKSHEPIDE